jgi:hypothetical protein
MYYSSISVSSKLKPKAHYPVLKYSCEYGQQKKTPSADLYSQTSVKAGVVPPIAYRAVLGRR